MNRIMNDTGSLVEVIGAPGSLERVKMERPRLIDTLNRLYEASFGCYGRCIDEAIEIIRAEGVRNPLETRNVLLASRYGEERQGSVTALITGQAPAGPRIHGHTD